MHVRWPARSNSCVPTTSAGQIRELRHLGHARYAAEKVAVELAKPLQNKGFWQINGLWVEWRPVGDGVTQHHKPLISCHLIRLPLLRRAAVRGSSFQSAISIVRLARAPAGPLVGDTSGQTRASLSSRFAETKASSMTGAKRRSAIAGRTLPIREGASLKGIARETRQLRRDRQARSSDHPF